MQQTAGHLRQLLLGQPYRKVWLVHGRERERHNEIHQTAVTGALGRFIDRHRDDRRYRDLSLHSLPQRVSRALRGQVLSRTTLQLFIDAFDITRDDADRLWRLYEGTDTIRVLTGPAALPPETAAALGPLNYRVRSLHEHHYLGPDGRPVRHRTQQVIQATRDRLDRYPYRFDTSALTVEVVEGGRLAGPLYRKHGEFYAVDIELDEPLRLGDDAPLEYLTLFHYGEMPKPEFRRAARRKMDDVGIRVEFHPGKVPQHIWWAVWNGIDGEITERELCPLRAGRYVYRHLDAIENTVVGFTWEW